MKTCYKNDDGIHVCVFRNEDDETGEFTHNKLFAELLDKVKNLKKAA